MLKHGGHDLVAALVPLFQELLDPKAVTPQEWRTAVIKVLLNYGDPQ